MNRCYQLIGIPASGKSTWVANQDWASECSIVSTDRFVEEHAVKEGKTYSEVFDSYMPIAVRLMANQVLIAQANNKNIIWDQTSTTIASRAKKFRMLPDYEHIAVVFRVPEVEELMRRLASRPGKEIPLDVIELMIKNWEDPSEEEGFKEIWFAR